MNKALDLLLPFLFEKLPLVKKLNGYKRTLGSLLVVLSASLAAASAQFPQLPWLAQVSLYVGLALKAMGDLHADSKDRARLH